MRILGIVGSPRKNGNTEIMINEVLNVASQAGWEAETFLLSEKQVAPCDACAACFQVGSCVVQDDMQELYEKLDRADAIVFGSPV
jgi:multimeric flavodoxin WrbA